MEWDIKCFKKWVIILVKVWEKKRKGYTNQFKLYLRQHLRQKIQTLKKRAKNNRIRKRLKPNYRLNNRFFNTDLKIDKLITF